MSHRRPLHRPKFGILHRPKFGILHRPKFGILLLAAVCVGLGAASLAIPAAIAYDPYAWLVWGRQIGGLQLDTVGGPSWKPFPVLITTVVAPLGGVAPAFWLVVSRAGALLAIVGVYRLAARFAGRWAGVFAVCALVLSPDPGPRFVRLVLEGHSAPITAALVVWAIDRHLDGKHATALVLATALALDRPEAWPFLALYALWLWRNDRALRGLVAGMCALVPLLWFGGDWWGSGSPLHGADAARVVADDEHRLVDSLRRVGEAVIAPAWAAALFAVFDAWRRRDRALIVLAAGAMAWFALVVTMSAVFGYAALSRFLLPGAAVICVLAGIGVVRLFSWLPTGYPRVMVAVLIVSVTLPFAVWRGHGIGGQVTEVADRHTEVEDLDVVIARAGGADAVARCNRISIDNPGVPRVALSWKLNVPLARVRTSLGRGAGVSFIEHRADPTRHAARRSARTGRRVELVARTGAWDVYGADCRPG